MFRSMIIMSCLAVLMIAVSLSGCGGTIASDEATATASQPASSCCGGPAGCTMDAGKHVEQMPASTEVTKAIAELPAEDRAAAEKQRICPVTDAALGSMGKPFKISVGGRDVFLCCEMCKDAVTENPDKYLAKLDK